jgi:hypothetical protein
VVADELATLYRDTADARCLLPDTDSASGSPRDASAWMLTPVAPARVGKSLQSLLTHPAIGMTRAEAALFKGHAGKRFTQNVCQAADSLGDLDAHELGRFSKSTAQSPDLVPEEALLRKHAAECSVLPHRYGASARVEKCMDRLLKFEHVLRSAAERARVQGLDLPPVGGWSPTFRGL